MKLINKLILRSVLSTLLLTASPFILAKSINETPSILDLKSCFVEGVRSQLACGKLTVPENWASPSDKTLDVNVIVVKAIASSSKPDPLFLLMGGPGQAASELVSGLIRIFSDVHQTRDLVFIDQRGTGLSSPLICDEEDGNIYQDLTSDFDSSDIQKCLNSFNVDLSQYNTNSAILDFEAVRVALGYEKINLYGISYGSRASMIYMRDKPQAIRSVVLDGVVPPQVAVGPLGGHAARAFDILIDQCEKHVDCKGQYSTLLSDYQKIRTQLEIAPIRTMIDHPVSDKKIALNIDSQKFIGTLHSQLYSVGRRELIPFIISEFAKGNYKPFVGLMSQNEDTTSKIYVGLNFNIVCNEDVPRATQEQLANDRTNSFSGRHSFEGLKDVCKQWPKFEAPINFANEIKSNIPTMLLSGELDPVTPPAWGDIAAKGLSNHTHYIAQNAGHGLVTQTCAGSMISDFIDSLNFDDVDSSCLDKQPLPGFLLNNNSNLNVKGQK